MKRILVLDTGYLDEFYKVDKYSNEIGYKEVKKRFSTAIKNNDSLYLPVSVIFELSNHIAHIKNSNQRKLLAQKLADNVETSVRLSSPFHIVPSEDFASAEKLVTTLLKFSENYALKGIGLTDTTVLLEAQRLRQRYPKDYCIHIWTRDSALKRLEPDPEQEAFI